MPWLTADISSKLLWRLLVFRSEPSTCQRRRAACVINNERRSSAECDNVISAGWPLLSSKQLFIQIVLGFPGTSPAPTETHFDGDYRRYQTGNKRCQTVLLPMMQQEQLFEWLSWPTQQTQPKRLSDVCCQSCRRSNYPNWTVEPTLRTLRL